MTPLRVTPAAARRFMRRALLLDAPVPDIATALSHHGYIQIDPINVCGRMHDLILRHRVRDYREGGLMRHLHGDGPPLSPQARTAFEHHLPTDHTLVALPLDAWPHLLSAMHHRTRRNGAWSGRLSPRQKEIAGRINAEIAARGPLSSEAFTDTGRSRAVWGSATQARTTLQKLFFHGRLLIARRGEDNRRFYDLPERVLPAGVLRLPEPAKTATARWETLQKLRQRRLVLLKKKQLPWVEDLVQAVLVDGCPTLHCLRQDLPLFELPALSSPLPAPLLLAPLDPLIYDRRVTSALWNFDYTWEAYTPPAKRVRGYYAQPVLVGTDLVGHVDAKVDRENRKLRVVARRIRRGHKLTVVIRPLARFLGLM